MFKVLGNGRVRQATDKNANTHNTKSKQQNKIGLERTNASHQCSMPTKEREAKENALDVYSFFLFTSLLLPASHTGCAPLCTWQKIIIIKKETRRSCCVALQLKKSKKKKNRRTAAGEGELLLANENVSTFVQQEDTQLCVQPRQNGALERKNGAAFFFSSPFFLVARCSWSLSHFQMDARS